MQFQFGPALPGNKSTSQLPSGNHLHIIIPFIWNVCLASHMKTSWIEYITIL